MKTTRRVAVVGLMLVVGVGLCVAYAGADLWTYPSPDEVDADPGSHDGQQVLAFVDVQSVEDGAVTVTWGSDPTVEFTVEGVSGELREQLQPGASIQLYGQLDADSTVLVADEVVVDMHGTADRLYTYGISIFGGLIAAGVFLWYWRINWRKLQFEPRGDR